MLILGGIHAAAKRVGHLPQLLLVTDGSAVVFFGFSFLLCHGSIRIARSVRMNNEANISPTGVFCQVEL